MYVNANGALVYSGTGTSTAPTQGQPGWVPAPGNAAQGPLTSIYQPNPNVLQPGQTAGNSAAPQRPPMNWGIAPPVASGPSFNTPVLDALYSTQQQRMTMPAPSFNFQATAPQQGALTQAIVGDSTTTV